METATKQSPLERAAQALHALYTEEKVRAGAKDMPTWEGLGDDGRFYFTHRARAVLNAVKPTGDHDGIFDGLAADWIDDILRG